MYVKYVGLLREDRKVEYNARFVLGDNIAETLEYGKTYDLKDFNTTLIGDSHSKDYKMKWKCVD